MTEKYRVEHTPETDPANNIWTMGYDKDGEWEPLEDYDSAQAAEQHANALNQAE
jgi:hypothetical protein